MQPHVVLIHGLWMTGLEMSLLKLRLSRDGFKTYTFFYPTVFRDLDDATDRLADYLKKLISRQPVETLHFVCHSMGGLVIRNLLARYPLALDGKLVTIGTPHQGSFVAQRFAAKPLGHFFLGSAARQAFLDETFLARFKEQDPASERQTLNIHGSYPVGLGRVITRIDEPHDGTVLVSETRWPQAKAQTVKDYPLSHFSLLFSSRVASDVSAFLKAAS